MGTLTRKHLLPDTDYEKVLSLSTGRHNDYVDANATGALVVEACHREKCFSVGIVDSNQLEDEESFEVSLFKNGLTDNIRIGSRRIAKITIRDDDSKFNINSVTPHTVCC